MKKPNLSIPIDPQLAKRIAQDAKRHGLSKADVVRYALRSYYGLLVK